MDDDSASTRKYPVEGAVTDRPWGLTLAALALDRYSGRLTLREGAHEVTSSSGIRRAAGGARLPDVATFRIELRQGVIVDATSPLPADAPLRVATTAKLVTAAQATDLRSRSGAHAVDVDAIAQALRWSSAQVETLRRLVIARCAARTFAIDHGRYVLEEDVTPLDSEVRIDVRAVIYHGVRMHLSDQRLSYDLRQLGAWFVLKPKTVDNLSGFEFGDVERPILEALRAGTNLAELEARDRELDPRAAQAVIYALATCDAVVCCESAAPPSDPARQPRARRATDALLETTPWGLPTTPTDVAWREPWRAMGLGPAGAPTPPANRTGPIDAARAIVQDDPFEREATSRVPTVRARGTRETPPMGVAPDDCDVPSNKKDDTGAIPVALGAHPSEGFVMRPTTVRPNALTPREVKALIVSRSTLLDLGADHFTLLGLQPGASPDEVRAAYIELARYLEPKHLTALGIPDDSYTARRLFAQICIAVTTLTDPVRRREYVAMLR